MYLVDQPRNSIFTEAELARLAVYRAAVAAGFYTDSDGSDATAETGELARLTNGDHPPASSPTDGPGDDAAHETV
jgi:hypothetical protein